MSDDMRETILTLEKLTKRFDRLTAVDAVDLQVVKGEILGFLGPNGAGKTTTIKMIAGLLQPSSGAISICGNDITSSPIHCRQLTGYIPDRPFLYEKLTGMEFLQFTADVYGVTHAVFQKKAFTLLEMFALADWGEELIESYSHGMKQRLIMSAALLHEPRVFIVDEPLVGLDPKGARLIKRIFTRLKRSGLTVFMSTHTLEVAEELCDRIGIIQKGELLAEGTVTELKELAGQEDPRLESIFLHLTGAETESTEDIGFIN